MVFATVDFVIYILCKTLIKQIRREGKRDKEGKLRNGQKEGEMGGQKNEPYIIIIL